MKIQAICKYNNHGYLLYAANFPGTYVRAESKEEALAKFGSEIRSYLR